MRAACVAFALLLTGCLNWRGPHHPAAGDELRAVAAAEDAWVAAGREDPRQFEQCDALEHVEIVIVSDRSPCLTFTNENGVLGYGPNAAACMMVVQPYVGAPPHLAIYLDISLDAQGRLNGIVHETLHYVRDCVSRHHLREGTRPSWYGQVGAGSDPRHQDAELWRDILENGLSEVRP